MTTASIWIRKNIFIVAAVVLPLLIVALFSLATLLPRIWVQAPQFDLLFVVPGAPEPVELDYEVEDEGIVVTARPVDGKQLRQRGRLYRYHAATGTVAPVDCPSPLSGNEIEALLEGLGDADTASTKQVRCLEDLIPGREAPDGYVADPGVYRGAGLFGELFGMSGRRDLLRLEKQGRVIGIDLPDGREIYYQQVEILGWAASERTAQ